MLHKVSSPLIVLALGIFVYASAQTKVLSLGVAGVANPQSDTVIVAVPLANISDQAVAVRITGIQLSNVKLRTSLPLDLSTIRGHASQIVQAEFDAKSLAPGK